MLRSFAEVIALFALPFMLFMLACFVRGRPLSLFDPDHREHMSRLVLAGLISAIIGILLLGFFEENKTGAYEPAVFKDGKLVPGRLQ